MRLVACAAPVGALLVALEDAPMTSAAVELIASVGDDDLSCWDAYWDASDADEPYYLHARLRDAWYRIDAEPSGGAGAGEEGAGAEAVVRRMGLAGRWASGAPRPSFCYVRTPRRGAPAEGEALLRATTAAVVAAAVESLVFPGSLPARTTSRWRAVAVRLDD